jgi:hypothetical protein
MDGCSLRGGTTGTVPKVGAVPKVGTVRTIGAILTLIIDRQQPQLLPDPQGFRFMAVTASLAPALAAGGVIAKIPVRAAKFLESFPSAAARIRFAVSRLKGNRLQCASDIQVAAASLKTL